MDEEKKIKFLIIRFSSIGDIVLTTPLVRCLKNQVDGAIVHYLTKPQYLDILKNNPYIDKIHIYNNFHQSIAELRNEGFDYLIDLHKNIRSIRLRNKLKILDFTFPKLNFKKFLLVNFKINKLPNIHIVDRYFEAVKLFDVSNDKQGLDYFFDDNIESSLKQKGISIPNKFITFAIGGQHNTKKLPNEKIIEICNNINYPIILLGGIEDSENSKIINSNCPKTIDLCGKLNLNESAFLIKKSNVVISHDTGLMHIAAALKKDIISIWGNTVPEFGMYPYMPGDNSKIFEVKNLKCRPCSKLGKKTCPKKHFYCMIKQNSKAIAALANQIVSE